MEINWLIIVLAFAAILAAITFLVKENQKDERELRRKTLEHDERMNSKQINPEV